MATREIRSNDTPNVQTARCQKSGRTIVVPNDKESSVTFVVDIHHLFLPIYSKNSKKKEQWSSPRNLSPPISPETFNPFFPFPIYDIRYNKAETWARSLERISVTQISRSVSNWKGRQVPSPPSWSWKIKREREREGGKRRKESEEKAQKRHWRFAGWQMSIGRLDYGPRVQLYASPVIDSHSL